MDKGQLFSVDAVVAASFIIFIILSTGITWGFSMSKVDEVESRNRINNKAYFASTALTQKPGKPFYWEEKGENWFNSTNIEYLGLAKSRPRQLDPEKIQALEDWNNTKYIEYKRLLNVEQYNLWIGIWEYNYSSSSFNTEPDYKAGIKPRNSSTEVVASQRMVTINRKWAKLVVKTWE